MTEPATFRKTAKGEEEIARRTYRLPARERSVLIMADGRTAAAEILRRAATLGDAAVLMGNLLAGGFVEAVADAPSAAPTPASAPAPATPFGNQHREAVRFASRFLLEALGPDSDMIGAQLESCSDAAQLVAMLEKCRDAIRIGAGKRKAEEFWAGAKARLPELE